MGGWKKEPYSPTLTSIVWGQGKSKEVGRQLVLGGRVDVIMAEKRLLQNLGENTGVKTYKKRS